MPEPLIPTPSLTTFQKQLTDWETKSKKFTAVAEQTQRKITAINTQLNELLPQAAESLQRERTQITLMQAGGLEAAAFAPAPAISPFKITQQISQLELQLPSLQQEFLKNTFYNQFYSGTVPYLIQQGVVKSEAEALSLFSLPDNLTDTELLQLKNDVSKLIQSSSTPDYGIEELRPEAVEPKTIEYPPLQPPPPSKGALGIGKIAVNEIVKSLTSPRLPKSEWTTEEYDNWLRGQDWSEEDIDNKDRITTEQLVAEALNQKSLIEAFKRESFQMPSKELTKVLYTAIVNPPIAVLEMLDFYYEHTSIPAAGWLFGSPHPIAAGFRETFTRAAFRPIGAGERGIPDITKAYNDFKQMHPDSTEREAWSYAWNNWGSAGPPIFDFLLKYMIMEGIVDPINIITLFSGMGMTKVMRALGPAGRVMGAGFDGLTAVLELPFDAIKFIATGMQRAGTAKFPSLRILVIPKTIAQQGDLMTKESESIIVLGLETASGFVPLHKLTMKQIKEAAELIIAHGKDSPRAEDNIAKAAQELLVHPPVTRTEAKRWLARIRATGVSTITDDQVTDQTLLNLTRTFEMSFSKQLTTVEDAEQLLRVLGVMSPTKDASDICEQIISGRISNIFDRVLDFTQSSRKGQALLNLRLKQQKIYRSIAESAALERATKEGRFALLVHDIDRKYISSWMFYINRYVIRSAADTYLMFAGYGFGNAGEDIFRSMLGGVMPGRTTTETYEQITTGLLRDPDYRTRSIVEMIGQLRDLDESAWHNWILTMSTLSAGIPTYLVTRGKITPRQVAEKAFEIMVGMPGALSADIRRNFVIGRYKQILADKGGDIYEALLKVVPDTVPSELVTAPKWMRKNLLRDLRDLVTTGKLTSDNVDLVKSLKARYTADKIMSVELESVLMKYPDIPASGRSLLRRALKEHTLFTSPESIEETVKLLSDSVLDDFLMSPERAAANIDALMKYLVELDVSNPADMAELIMSVYRLQTNYGMVPDQILALATVKSRGLPLDKRREHFNTELNRVAVYMDKAGASIDKLITMVEQTAAGKPFFGQIDWSKVPVRGIDDVDLLATVRGMFDKLPVSVKQGIREIRVGKGLTAADKGYFERRPTTLAFYDSLSNSVSVRSEKELVDFILYHELAHDMLIRQLDTGDNSLFKAWATAHVFDEDVSLRKGESGYRHYNRFPELHERFSNAFALWTGATPPTSLGKVPPLTTLEREFFALHFPLEQSPITLSSDQSASILRFANLTKTVRATVARAQLEDIEFRTTFFADATQRDLRNTEFWTRFENSELAFWKGQRKKLAILNGNLHRAIEDIATSQGAHIPLRPAVKVIGRPLAPSDVGALIGARGDDLSQMLLNTIIPEGDRDYFVEFVKSLVRPGIDEGFDDISIERVYNEIAQQLHISSSSSPLIRVAGLQVESLRRDLHDLYNRKLFPKKMKADIDKFIDDTVAKVDDLTHKRVVPEDLGLTERIATPEDIKSLDAGVEEYVKYLVSRDYTPEDAREVATGMFFGDEGRQAVVSGKVPIADLQGIQRLKGYLTDAAKNVKVGDYLTDVHKAVIANLKSSDEVKDALRQAGVDILDIDDMSPDTLLTVLEEAADKTSNDVASGILNSAAEELDSAIVTNFATLEDYITSWFDTARNPSLQQIGRIASSSTDYLKHIRSILQKSYPSGYIRIYRGEGRAGRRFLEREFTNVTSSKRVAKDFRSTWSLEGQPDPDPYISNVLIKIDDVVAIGSVDESELIVPAKVLRDRIDNPIKEPLTIKDSFKDYDTIRQDSYDEALTWYYKEYTDYSSSNMLDAVMTQLFPFWKYESQRWLWLPRTALRRPSTLAAWGRWENNTEDGYIHIPGTNLDVHPARGTVLGPWSTRLMKPDFPEYYDELEGAQGIVGFADWISRYGFYPNAIFGYSLALLGGRESQLGSVIPAAVATPLNALIAAFPDNKLVNFISNKVFPDNFRNFLTARKVDDLGGDGSLLWSKTKAGKALDPDEEYLWTTARRSVALHSALFEQTGFLRMRSDESYALAQASAKLIEEWKGITVEQQKELRRRGERVWDVLGGLHPWEQEVLEELEYYKYAGSINPLLPGAQQEILRQNELDWADVERYSDLMQLEILDLQQDFLTGSTRGRLGPEDFLQRVRDLHRKRRDYVDEKVKNNSYMLLENRAAYYEKYGVVTPVQSPYKELMNMYMTVELEDTIDPATGERIYDWDKFFATREMIQDAIPESDRADWDTYIARNTAPIMSIWREVYDTYFRKYYGLWEAVLQTYPDNEQQLINEYLYLRRTGQQSVRQQELELATSTKTGKQLISGFRSQVSDERELLRYSNPHLDAWLHYWKPSSYTLKTAKSEQVYKQISATTGRVID